MEQEPRQDAPPPAAATLESTNMLLSDLERKLSFISTTSSNQTQQSQGLSVIVNKNLAGMGKQNIHSTVLQYFKNEDDFDPNELFHDRQLKFMTKFGKHYNDDNTARNLDIHPNRSVHIYDDDDEADDLEDDTTTTHINDLPLHNTTSTTDTSNDSISKMNYDTIEVEDPDILEDKDAMYVEDVDDVDVESFTDEEDQYSDDNDEDLLLPPSPPRTPPRELDPDKLYGLYDFAGPDPSHCSLARDEPVFLVNDLDNYWWLIRKMSKHERILYGRKRNLLYQDHHNSDDELSDEEDGKIGFVPAECLETHGERLARLNCFKNEELERTSRDNITETEDPANNSSTSFGEPLESGLQLSKSSSLLRRNNSTTRSTNKSVTFENLGDLDLNEEDNETDEYIRDHREFETNFYDIPHEDILKEKQGNLLVPPRDDQERTSEILSDVYPTETPLVINKNGSKKKSLQSSLLHDPVMSVFQDPQLVRPPQPSSQQDTASIGSFSPDTPPPRNPKKVPTSPEDPLTLLRRSVILDRLSQVTSDIQQHIQLDHYGSGAEQDEEQEDQEEDEEEQEEVVMVEEDDDDDDDKEIEQARREPSHVEKEQSHTPEFQRFEPLENGPFFDDDDDDDDDDDILANHDDGEITPLTSMNSLNYGTVATPTKAELADRRKSKPVHDMFMPILGKFDELAEKLAELDGML